MIYLHVKTLMNAMKPVIIVLRVVRTQLDRTNVDVLQMAFIWAPMDIPALVHDNILCWRFIMLDIMCSPIILDIDECSDGSNNCAQNCINTAGSYRCNCNSGYTLATDGSSCTGMVLCKYWGLPGGVHLSPRLYNKHDMAWIIKCSPLINKCIWLPWYFVG